MSDDGPCNCDQALGLERLVANVAQAWEAWHEVPDKFPSEEVIEACWACVEHVKERKFELPEEQT